MVPTDLLAHLSQRMATVIASETVEIWRQYTTSDGAGGVEVTWRRVAASVPGAKTYNTSSHSEMAGSVTLEGEWRWALPIGTDIRTSDEIRTEAGAWGVIGTDELRSQALMLTVRCNLVEDGRA